MFKNHRKTNCTGSNLQFTPETVFPSLHSVPTMQQPATRQTGIQTPSSQLIDSLQGPVPLNQPIVAAPAPGQPIMYQMRSGQLQPVLLQAVPSQPTMPQEGQHIQYYVPTGGQLVQQAQQVQPVQPVQGQGPVSGQSQHQDPDMSPIQFNKAYMKSGLGLSRFGEFVSTRNVFEVAL